MRAVVITRPGDPGVLDLREVPDPPPPGPGEVLVAVDATAVNRADILQRLGRYPAPAGTRDDVPGLEMAGRILETGRGVTGWEAGDRVMALLPGEGYAERVVTPATMLMPVPDSLTTVEAAAIPEAFLTAFDALFLQGGLSPGETVLIHAAGSGVGTAAVQLAASAGCRSIGVAGSPAKLERAADLGLGVGVDRHREDFAAVVADQTHGRGVDVVLDLVGGGAWAGNIASLAPRGRMVLVGTLAGRTAEIDIGAVMGKRLRIHGTVLRSRPVWEKAALTAEFCRRVLPRFADGTLRPVVDRVLPLAEAAAAHRAVEDDATFGKVVLRVGP
jgi:putative PIG3 family NAD(P)H quinone oxidoreductase